MRQSKLTKLFHKLKSLDVWSSKNCCITENEKCWYKGYGFTEHFNS